MNILVTGGSGLVGKYLQDILPEAIYVSSSAYDLTKMSDVREMMIDFEPNVVIHLAARVGGIMDNINYPVDYLEENVLMNTNVLKKCHECNIEKVIGILSTCIYPNDVTYPLREEQIHNGSPHFSNYAYAYAKRMVDIQIRAYREQYEEINYISAIPTNIYGKHDNFDFENGHVLPSLIHKCYLAKKDNMDFVVWGTGNPLREFIYAKDVALLTEWALKNYNEEEPIIFSTSEEISIKEVVDLIVEYIGFKGKVIFDSDKPDGQFRKPSDNSKLMSYLPDFKFTPIEVGLQETIEWFIENYRSARV